MRSMELWVGCVAGALHEREYRTSPHRRRFESVDVDRGANTSSTTRAFLAAGGLDVDAIARQVEGKIASAFIRARKPSAKRPAAVRPAAHRRRLA